MRDLTDITLHNTTNPTVDLIVRSTILLFEAAFPGRVGGIFVEGSYANHTALPYSDLDLIVVFKDHFVHETECQDAQRVASACSALSQLELDIDISDEASLKLGADPMFALGALCLYGTDIRKTIPLLPVQQWARQRMHAAYWLMINVFHRPRLVHPPLAYPLPTSPLLGYDQRTIRRPDGQEAPSTRDLVRVVTWIATALVAYQSGSYVVAKQEVPGAYRQVVHDRFANLVEQVYQDCRENWGYAIPADKVALQRLRTLCERVLTFENHFLDIYRKFLLDELSNSDGTAQEDALRLLENTYLDDAEITQAVEQLKTHPQASIRKAANTVLQFREHLVSA